jgi:hypothetical protein
MLSSEYRFFNYTLLGAEFQRCKRMNGCARFWVRCNKKSPRMNLNVFKFILGPQFGLPHTKGMSLQCFTSLFYANWLDILFEISSAFESTKLEYFDVCHCHPHP